MKNWDYGATAMYFVTICTQKHACFFGEIENGEMQLSDIGLSAQSIWTDIPKQFPCIILDEFVVMPNHVHGLLYIREPDDSNRRDVIHHVSDTYAKDGGKQDAMNSDAMNRVSTGGGITGSSNPMLHQNLSTIIRWFKGRVTYAVREKHRDFKWQARFHDHIVRNQRSLDKIRNYILNNASIWEKDTFFPNAP